MIGSWRLAGSAAGASKLAERRSATTPKSQKLFRDWGVIMVWKNFVQNSGSGFLKAGVPSRIVLRQDEHRVRPQTHVGLKGHCVPRAGAGHGVVAQLVAEVRAVALPV